ncbi:MAG: Histidine kinase [Massilia sp.]|jgi:signal transduction histidine kinase|nr:Histidine kinase [Massilia sp.]
MTAPEAHHPDPELERLVAERTAELTELVAHLMSCWDDDRRLLARQLHDTLGSSMTALTMHLGLLSKGLSDGKSLDRAGQMKSLLNGIIETNRKVQLTLWNDKLEFLGIKAALAELVAEFSQEHGVQAHASLPDDDDAYSRAQNVALLRCAEEGLRNALEHAQASKVELILDDDGDQLMLTVRDNGVGLARAPSAGSLHCHGLRLLRERARSLGGTLSLGPAAAGGGAALTMTLPRRQAA